MPHADTSKSRATNRTSILPCLTDTSKSQETNRTSGHASHRYHRITGNKSYILPCLAQIPANPRQQNVLLTMLHTDTSKSQATNRTSYHALHRYQQITGNKTYIVLLALPHTDTSKSQATNHISYHASRRYQQHTGNKSYILRCLTQIPAHHRQQIVHVTMPHGDTSKSQATNRTSCHASHRYHQITGNKSNILPCLTQIPANHRQ